MKPLNPGNIITCSDTTSGAETMFYQENSFIGYQHIQSLKPKFSPFNKEIANFIISASHASVKKGLYDYGNKFNRDNMRQVKIILPVKGNKIDFDFITDWMTDLRKNKVLNLKQQLYQKGLDRSPLTSDEKQMLDGLENISWASFNIKSLFDESDRGKRLKSIDRIPGNLPFITAGEANEGVSDFIGNDVKTYPANTVTIDMFGSAKFRNFEYGADDHCTIVHTENIPEKAAVFVASACHKAAYTGEFNYGRNFYPKDADALNIMLPVKDGKPDYKTMELIISAVQKLILQKLDQLV